MTLLSISFAFLGHLACSPSAPFLEMTRNKPGVGRGGKKKGDGVSSSLRLEGHCVCSKQDSHKVKEDGRA
jgi:hypothetical protein